MRGRWEVWTWLRHDDGTPFYVGRGKIGRDGQHPAAKLWNDRKKRDSELNVYIRNHFDAEPKRTDDFPGLDMSREVATVLWEMSIEESEEEGHRLLSARPTDRPAWSYNSGFKARRAVIGPDGTRYASVRQAARAVGVTPATVTLNCQLGKTWHYADGK